MSGLPQAVTETLPQISVVDVRDGGPVQHAREGALRAQALRDDCLAWFPAIAAPALPLMDRLARRWLIRSCSPYVADIEAIAASLGFPGIWLLNGSYQWGCTALAREDCASFEEARTRLETTPIARPVIYTLAGIHPGERCVIERTETGHNTRRTSTCAANDWLETVPGWEGRVGADVVMTCSGAEAMAASRRRRDALA